jgi:hypothetical protein
MSRGEGTTEQVCRSSSAAGAGSRVTPFPSTARRRHAGQPLWMWGCTCRWDGRLCETCCIWRDPAARQAVAAAVRPKAAER